MSLARFGKMRIVRTARTDELAAEPLHVARHDLGATRDAVCHRGFARIRLAALLVFAGDARLWARLTQMAIEVAMRDSGAHTAHMNRRACTQKCWGGRRNASAEIERKKKRTSWATDTRGKSLDASRIGR